MAPRPGNSSPPPLDDAATKKLGRFKWAFIDALTAAAPPITDLDVRVGIRLVKYYNSLVGAAWPSQERLAEECHCDIRSINRCINRLVEDGWFRKRSGRGRENTNRYRPDWSRVTPESPFHEPKENTRESEREKVTPGSENMTLGSVEGDSRVRERVTSESSYTVRENLQETERDAVASKNTTASLASPPEGGSRSLSPVGKQQVVRQGSGEGFEDGASIGEDVASGVIIPGEPSPPLDTEDPRTSSPDEPLSSTLTVNRPIPGAEGPDHAQRSFGPMVVLNGGLETKEAADHGKVDDALAPLLAAKKAVKDAIGQRKFVERDIELDHRLRLATVPDDARDGVRRLQYLEWANELVETPIASGAVA